MSAPEATTAPTATAPAPVTPAAAIVDGPAKALDAVAGEPTILDKAKGIAKPYLTKVEPYIEKGKVATQPYIEKAQVATQPYIEKAQVATKPYADKAALKFEQIVDKIEGNSPSTSATPTSAGTLEKTVDDAAAATSGAAGSAAAVAGETGEKAKGIFEQGLSAVQSTFTQLTNTIEQRTTTESHPGLITQVTNAVNKGVEKVEGLLGEATDATVPPTATTTASAAQPVQTTTNAVPHVGPTAP